MTPADPPLPRQARPLDAFTLAALHGRCFPEAWDAAFLSALIAQPSVFGLVIDQIGAPPSAMLLARAAAGEAEILTVAVAPEDRRTGLAEFLCRALIARLASVGASEVFLEVDEENRPARALYAKLGFVEMGRRPLYYETAGADAILLRLTLA